MLKTPERKLTWAFGLALLLLLSNALVSFWDLAELASSDHLVARTRWLLERVAEVGSARRAVESARRGCWLDDEGRADAEFGRALGGLERATTALAEAYRPGGEMGRRAEAIVREARRCPPELLASAERARRERPERAAWAGSGDRFAVDLARFDALVAEALAGGRDDLARRLDERQMRTRRAVATVSVVSTLALLAVGVTLGLVRRHLADRTLVERAVAESEARFRLLFESVGEGIYGVDTQGRCTFCNPSALRILGFESDRQVLGRDMHALIHHTRADGTAFPAEECPIYQTFRSGRGVDGREDDFYRADGTPVPVDYRAHAIRRGRETLGAVVTFVDVGSRRQLETDMGLRNRALRAIGQGVFIVDPAREGDPILYANAAFERITGIDPVAWPGQDAAGSARPMLAAKLAEFHHTVGQGLEVSTEFPISPQDGSPSWLKLNMYPVEDRDGRVTHFVGVVTDVTERRWHENQLRESEERLRLMVESVADYALFSVDLEGRVSSWNTGAERLFGFGEAEILREPYETLFTAADRDARVPALELERTGATGRSEDERWHVRGDGSRFLASGTTTAVRDRAGALVGYTKVARDITRAKQAEWELRAARDASEAATRAKNAFLSTMGHELRTPLNAIIGYSELLEEDAADRDLPGFVADLARIREAGHLLLKLINQVFDLSRIESGGLAIAREPFALPDLIREVVLSVAADAERRGNAVQVQFPATLTTYAGDFAKVKQCLGHLLSNAIKFTEAGTVGLKVGCEVDGSSRAWLVFAVTDDGIGMTRDEVARLFQPFVQGDGSSARKYGGSGLGLTIASRFCHLMGGSIEVQSEPGVGSTFLMRLPIVGDDPPGAAD